MAQSFTTSLVGQNRINLFMEPTLEMALCPDYQQGSTIFQDLGVTKTHSRPHVSNDNPFSKAQFKTLKYQPDYPGCFGYQLDARR